MKDKLVAPKRILFCRLGGIGDVIHTLPLVKYLRDVYPNASLEYLTAPNVGELLTKCCPYIDKIWIFKKDKKKQLANEILNNLNIRHKVQALNSQLSAYSSRLKPIDYFFNLHGSLSFFLFNLFYIKARRFFQFKKDRSMHAVINFAKTYDPNISSFNLDSKTLFVVSNEDNFLELYDLKNKKYVCLVPGVGKARVHRSWKIENWISLTSSLLDNEKDVKVVFLGGPDESELKNYIPVSNGKIINLIGKLSLSDVVKIITSANCLISCDTGLLHIASALHTRVISLFGPTLPLTTGPFTSNYEVLQAKNCMCVTNSKAKHCKVKKASSGYCMNEIKVEDVLEKVSFC